MWLSVPVLDHAIQIGQVVVLDWVPVDRWPRHGAIEVEAQHRAGPLTVEHLQRWPRRRCWWASVRAQRLVVRAAIVVADTHGIALTHPLSRLDVAALRA